MHGAYTLEQIENDRFQLVSDVKWILCVCVCVQLHFAMTTNYIEIEPREMGYCVGQFN